MTSDLPCPVTSDIFWVIMDPLIPTLKSDVIYGRSLELTRVKAADLQISWVTIQQVLIEGARPINHLIMQGC